MEQPMNWRGRLRTTLVWLATILTSLGIGLAGLTKFLQSDHWQTLFVGWGYPRWFSAAVGIAEMGGAIALLVPRLAFYAAVVLATIMLGALLTLLTHSGGPMGWGATPTFYLVVLALVGAARWKEVRAP